MNPQQTTVEGKRTLEVRHRYLGKRVSTYTRFRASLPRVAVAIATVFQGTV